jgi:uncharacterized membrane protein
MGAARKSGKEQAQEAAAVAAASRERRYGRLVIVAMVAFAAIMVILSIQSFRDYKSMRYDVGIMTQTVYNTAHGRFLEATTADGRQASRLGSHVDPILAAFALPWLVWPSPVMLLVAQALIVALAAWPAFRLGKRFLGDPLAAFVMCCVLLLYPPTQRAVLDGFHPVTLVLTFLLFAFLYLEEDRPWVAVPFLVLAALCKEEIPLLIALMGLYFALRKRRWWPLIVTAVGVVWFVIAVGFVIPHYSAGGSPFIERYSAYGSDTGEIAGNVFLKPGQTMRDLVSGSNLGYLHSLLWPLAYTPLVSPLTLLIAAPEFVINGLSSHELQRSTYFHYVATEIPFLFAASLLGIARLRRWVERRRAAAPKGFGGWLDRHASVAALSTFVLAFAVVANYVGGPLPFSFPGARFSGADYRVSAHSKVLDEAVAMIPAGDGVVVCSANVAGAHLSARRVIYGFPYIDSADWVIVDQSWPFAFDKVDKVLHDQALGSLVLNQSFVSVYARDNVYVFKRVADVPPLQPGGAPGLLPGGSSAPAPGASLPAPAGSPAAGD